MTPQQSAQAVAAFNRAAAYRLLSWRLKDADEVECLVAAIEASKSDAIDALTDECYDNPRVMLQRSSSPLWEAIRALQVNAEAVSQHVACCGDQVKSLQEDNERLKREIKYLRHYGNKSCTARADNAMADGELDR